MSEQTIFQQSRPFSLALYLLIVFGLSWPFLIVSAIWGGADFSLVYALNCTAMIMVAVGTYIAGRYVFRDGFADAGWSWGKPRYYLAVIGLALLLWVVPTCVDLAVKTLPLPTYITPTQIIWVFVLLFGTLIPGFGEEFGWRGYMLPHLAQRMNARRAVLLHAVIWWIWHLPVLIGNAVLAASASAKPVPSLPIGATITLAVLMIVLLSAIPTILHGVIFAYIWTRCRSLAVSSVYHASYDGIRDSLTLTLGLGPIAGMWANLVLIILGIFLLWKGNWTSLQANSLPAEPSLPTSQMAFNK